MPIKIFYLILILLTLIEAIDIDKKKFFPPNSLISYDYCFFNCGGHGQCFQVGKEIGTNSYRCLCDEGYCDERDERGNI